MAVFAVCAVLAACGGSGFNTSSLEGAVANTRNPLVAQYTVASGCEGQVMVEFGPDTNYGRNTAWYPIAGLYKPTVILVAGMRANTTYHMRAQEQCFGNTITSPDTTFTTGPLPSNLPVLQFQVTRPSSTTGASENPGIELVDIQDANFLQAIFTDRDGNPIWYYDVGPGNSPYVYKLLPNGHIIISVFPGLAAPGSAFIREIDLAGNTIRELDIGTLTQKLQAAGFDFSPVSFHHEIVPLANGHLIVLVNSYKNFTDLSGYPGQIAVLGDQIVDLDENWNPVWAWNTFDHLDVNRHLAGLPDWTHSNGIVYTPQDGNLLLSIRHQSWLIKINYDNGAGTGNIMWKLGYQGDFSLTQNGVPTDDPSLWFSFQHFPSLVSQNGSNLDVAIWDNGDNRVMNTSGLLCGPSGPACYSRATIYDLDESSMVADLAFEDFPNLYSVWGGTCSQLADGNVEFEVNSPLVPPAPNIAAEVQEVTQTSNPQLVWKMDINAYAYRVYRVPSLYPGVTWQY